MFAEIQFPSDISYGASGGPAFSTIITSNRNGYEQRVSNWANARARYNVAHGIKSDEQLASLIAFFRARKGRAQAFRFKDWADYRANSEQIGVGDDTQTDFQLVKNYSSGADNFVRNIYKPISGSVKIYFDSNEQLSGWNVDSSTGIVSFDSAVANNVVITADFEFDIAARFDTDQLVTSIDAYGAGSWLDIPIIEVRI